MGRFAAALVVVLATSLLAACSSGGSETNNASDDHSGMGMSRDGMRSMHGDNGTVGRPVVPGAREIAVKGDALAFDPKTITVKAGEDVTIAFTAVDAEHDFYLEDIGHVVHATAGERARADLEIDTL